MKPRKVKNILSLQNSVILFFLIITFLSILMPYFKLDLLIAEKIQGINSQIFSGVMWFVSLLGNQPLMIVIVAVTSLILFLLKIRAEAIILALTTAAGSLSGSLIKVLIDRPRPTPALVRVSVFFSDKSYPSGHVLAFTIFFGFLLYLLIKRTTHRARGIIPAIVFILLIATIGISRIYLGAHWPSDVLGGYLLGIIWLLLAIRLYNSYHGQR